MRVDFSSVDLYAVAGATSFPSVLAARLFMNHAIVMNVNLRMHILTKLCLSIPQQCVLALLITRRQLADGLRSMLRTYQRILLRRRHRMRIMILFQLFAAKFRDGWRLQT